MISQRKLSYYKALPCLRQMLLQYPDNPLPEAIATRMRDLPFTDLISLDS